MKQEVIIKLLKTHFKAKEVLKAGVIQNLWSGYGEIARYELKGTTIPSIIVKHIDLKQSTNHPRGWNTNNSHNRKVKSYQIEQEWYQSWAKKCNPDCKVPECYFTWREEEMQLIVLEDLDASGYFKRKSTLNLGEAKVVLQWLAKFHARFMNQEPTNLWKEGSYWHLNTRQDEYELMQPSELKDKAEMIDAALKNGHFQTIIHGDSKVANFCFSENLKEVAAVDFQYVGGGCGMKDVAYFLSSCMHETECDNYESILLDYYFSELEIALNKHHKSIEFNKLEAEWRALYSTAWADFTRFLLGWMPTHQKINGYSLKMVEKTLRVV